MGDSRINIIFAFSACGSKQNANSVIEEKADIGKVQADSKE